MCVIIACTKEFPDTRTLELCAKKNPDGGGIAWIENGVVRFEKGLNFGVEEVEALLPQVKLPAVIHFRIASVGHITDELCHPFAIGSTNPLKGQSSKGVVFHNGTWTDWRKAVLNALNRGRRAVLPKGLWNDSRAMAFLASIYGVSFLQLLDERIALLTPDDGLELFGRGWETDESGVWFSNMHWKNVATKHVGFSPGTATSNLGTGNGTSANVAVPTPTTARTINPLLCPHPSGSRKEWQGYVFCDDCGKVVSDPSIACAHPHALREGRNGMTYCKLCKSNITTADAAEAPGVTVPPVPDQPLLPMDTLPQHRAERLQKAAPRLTRMQESLSTLSH